MKHSDPVSSICREGSQSDNRIPAASLHCLFAIRSGIFLRSDRLTMAGFDLECLPEAIGFTFVRLCIGTH